MGTIKTITLDELKKLPPISEERLEEIKNFVNEDFSDCPIQTKEELKQFRPAHFHPTSIELPSNFHRKNCK